jgi:hypothetical protein
MRALGRRRWEDNVKVDLKEISCEDVKWMELYIVTKKLHINVKRVLYYEHNIPTQRGELKRMDIPRYYTSLGTIYHI